MGKWIFLISISFEDQGNFSETNLKVRQSIEDIQPLGDDIEQLSKFDGIF